MNLELRNMTRTELDWAVGLAAAEGWNPGTHDAEAFYNADPEGFFVALIDGNPVGCISAVRYPDDFLFVGFYIVLPEFRPMGVWKPLWQAAKARAGGCIIGLDGVLPKEPYYAKFGFVSTGRNHRFVLESSTRGCDEKRLLPLESLPFSEIAAFDRTAFPSTRDAFLSAWLGMPNASGLALRGDLGLEGYGIIRKCGEGWKIGPLFAVNRVGAETLYHGLCARAEPGENIYLDVPGTNPAAMKMAEDLGMKEGFATARMYRGGTPSFDESRVFGITSFELG